MKQIKKGDQAVLTKTITEAEVRQYAQLLGDADSFHMDEQKAKETVFGRRIVHGMLVGSYIAKVLGLQLPGEGTIYLEQDMKFRKPVFFDDTITVRVTVDEVLNAGKGIYRMGTIVTNQEGDTVVDGYAVVKYQASV
jgi:3-hydroxybutyryl-CoA dehydratase